VAGYAHAGPMNPFRVKRGSPIAAEIAVPGDKSISHRAIMLAALSNGPCRITGFLEGEDCLSTLAIISALGVRVERPTSDAIIVHGCKGAFSPPTEDLDCGNSGTTMRLMSGLLAAQPFPSRMVGDASLSKRPMRRVIEPLSRMGARLRALGEGERPPLEIQGGALHGIDYTSPVASAQVKSAILLAGLLADGITSVTEPAPSRDHTERMLKYFLVKLRREEVREAPLARPSSCKVTLAGRQVLESRDFAVPGDISSAAFWLVATAARPGSRVVVRGVGLNPTRTGILDVLVRMGARVREHVTASEQTEPAGTVEVLGSALHGTTIGGAEIPNVIDELPAIAVAAALAKGETVIKDAAELRVKETDRIAAVAGNLRAMGVRVDEAPDGMTIHGGTELKGCQLQSFGDHRIAMAFSVAGLFAKGTTEIHDTACVATSYPGFADMLKVFQKGGARVRAGFPTPVEEKFPEDEA